MSADKGGLLALWRRHLAGHEACGRDISSACSLKLDTVGFALQSVRWLPASLGQFLASKTREPLTYGTTRMA